MEVADHSSVNNWAPHVAKYTQSKCIPHPAAYFASGFYGAYLPATCLVYFHMHMYGAVHGQIALCYVTCNMCNFTCVLIVGFLFV